MKKITTHIKYETTCLSNCCNSSVTALEPMTFYMMVKKIKQKIECDHCKKECQDNWVPVYEYIGEGSYRKIVYTIKTK